MKLELTAFLAASAVLPSSMEVQLATIPRRLRNHNRELSTAANEDILDMSTPMSMSMMVSVDQLVSMLIPHNLCCSLHPHCIQYPFTLYQIQDVVSNSVSNSVTNSKANSFNPELLEMMVSTLGIFLIPFVQLSNMSLAIYI